MGRWTAILTLLFGAFLIAGYLPTHDVEAGTLLYFYIIGAGIINTVVFLFVLLAYLFYRKDKTRLLRTSIFIAISYLIILGISYYVI